MPSRPCILQLCFFWIALLSGRSQGHAQLQHIQRQIEKIIRFESGIDTSLVPGIVVCLSDQGNAMCFTFGNGVSESDVFELGSLTKPVTAFLAMKALDSLKRSAATPVCDFLPDSLCQGRWSELTIEDILEHKTGLPRLPGNMGSWEADLNDPFMAYDVSKMAKDIKDLEPIPGRYSYSHIGYAVLHWVFEQVGGLEKFSEKVLPKQISGGGMLWMCPDSLITGGHGFDGLPARVWHTNAMAPAMGLKATARDVLRFLDVQAPLLGNAGSPLTDELKRELAIYDRSGSYKVNQGWFMIRSGNSVVYYHNGRTGGHQVSVAFLPAREKEVVVFSNGAAGTNELSLSILTMLKRAKNKRFLRHT